MEGVWVRRGSVLLFVGASLSGGVVVVVEVVSGVHVLEGSEGEVDGGGEGSAVLGRFRRYLEMPFWPIAPSLGLALVVGALRLGMVVVWKGRWSGDDRVVLRKNEVDKICWNRESRTEDFMRKRA